jgi:AcrR family transcriptional regulator
MNHKETNGLDENSGSGTHAALVDAGRRLFARHGFDGASVRAITSEAGANLGAITYHFGTKRGLYERVLETFITPLSERVLAAARGPGDVFARVEAVVRAYFELLAENPDAPHLMMQELVLSGGTLSGFALERIRPVHAALTALLREGQDQGRVRSGNPAIMAISIVAQPVYTMLMRRPLQAVTGRDLNDAAVREQFVENAVAFVRGGLAAPVKGMS